MIGYSGFLFWWGEVMINMGLWGCWFWWLAGDRKDSLNQKVIETNFTNIFFKTPEKLLEVNDINCEKYPIGIAFYGQRTGCKEVKINSKTLC